MKIKMFVLILCAGLFAACGGNKTKDGANKLDKSASESQNQAVDVPYTVACNYFANNSVANQELTLVITKEEEFAKYFGMASTMLNKPTPIDFTQQYVVAVIGTETDRDTSIAPGSMVQSNGVITLTVSKDMKAKQSFTIRPSLLLIVSKQFAGEVKFVIQ